MRSRRLGQIGSYAIFAFVAMIVLFPLVWMFYTSFKEQYQIFEDPFGLPTSLNPANYEKAWTTGDFGTYFLNSLIVTIPSVILTVSVAALAAYAFARLRFRGRNAVFVFLIVGLIIPPQAIIVPAYQIISKLGLISNYLALILTYLSWCSIGIVILTPFFRSIPHEIIDAAIVDGAGRFGVFRHVALPLAQPALVTVAIFYFVFIWNDFLYPLIYMQKAELATIPMGLVLFNGRYRVDWGLQTAALSIATLVPVAFYLMFQSKFIKGITAGSVKG